MAPSVATSELPLFPLQAVLFPGGLLSLKVFEARYLDLMVACLREQQPFGVVALRTASPATPEAQAPDPPEELESTGVVAELLDVDSTRAGVLQVRARGLQRFAVTAARQSADGLWRAGTMALPDDAAVAPAEAVLGTVKGLANAIATLKSQGAQPFLEPYRFDQAGWVANRWCEILPISLSAKQRLMELADPTVRLQLVDEYLRSKGVV
jgi:uncharacterized protein